MQRIRAKSLRTRSSLDRMQSKARMTNAYGGGSGFLTKTFPVSESSSSRKHATPQTREKLTSLTCLTTSLRNFGRYILASQDMTLASKVISCPDVHHLRRSPALTFSSYITHFSRPLHSSFSLT